MNYAKRPIPPLFFIYYVSLFLPYLLYSGASRQEGSLLTFTFLSIRTQVPIPAPLDETRSSTGVA